MRPLLPLDCNNQDNQDNPSRTPRVPLEYPQSTISVRAYLEYLVSTPEYRVSTLAAQLFPDHPNLLASTWEPTAAMRADGYVTKPVSGRGGEYPVSAYPTRLHPSACNRRGCIHPHATDAVASARDRFAIISNAPTGFRAVLLVRSLSGIYGGSHRRRARADL